MSNDTPDAAGQAEWRPLTRQELVEALRVALGSSSGSVTRADECWMATVCAAHVAEKLAVAGIRAFAQPDIRSRPTYLGGHGGRT